MRLWSLHPSYLDARGLVALWREALLARAVLRGQTKGYTKHPQLNRFRESGAPVTNIGSYLAVVYEESVRRGYKFNGTTIACGQATARMAVTAGQIDCEWNHLRAKLTARAPEWLAGLRVTGRPRVHPLFRVVAGPIEPWEVGASPRRR